MREILFRGKINTELDGCEDLKSECTKDGWLFGSLAHAGNVPYLLGDIQDADECGFTTLFWYPVIEASVGQFTGLVDKNGTKIFEGDILSNKTAKSMYSEYGEKYVVVYNETLARFECGYQFGIAQYLLLGAEVIGNTFDNPEAL